MGKIKQGILGGFKGKVGTVIGSSWNGIAYMKGQPQSRTIGAACLLQGTAGNRFPALQRAAGIPVSQRT